MAKRHKIRRKLRCLKTGRVFNGFTEAARFYGVSDTTVKLHAMGRIKKPQVEISVEILDAPVRPLTRSAFCRALIINLHKIANEDSMEKSLSDGLQAFLETKRNAGAIPLVPRFSLTWDDFQRQVTIVWEPGDLSTLKGAFLPEPKE